MSMNNELETLASAVELDLTHKPGGYMGFTEVYVTGEAAAVKAYCNEYVKNWNPWGYGTTVTGQGDHGKVTYRIWHSNSCD